jgi:Vitamin K-dependent gamma-carboxylase
MTTSRITKFTTGLKKLVISVDDWCCDPVDPRPISLFRGIFGLLSLINLLLMWPDLQMWLGNTGVLPPEVHRFFGSTPRLSFYFFMGYDDRAITLIKGLGLLGGVGLILGIWPRIAAFFMWLVVSSYCWRNPHILHSGDNLIRIGSFFLIFARSDAAFSAGPRIRHWCHRLFDKNYSSKYFKMDSSELAKIPAWPQRILQLQLCVLYLVAGIWKAKGIPWQNGTAVGTVLQLGEFQRFPIPDFLMTPFFSMVLTYSTLVIELGFPFLVWVPRLRVATLLAGLGLHLGLEWTMNIQLFQMTILSYYILFLKFK